VRDDDDDEATEKKKEESKEDTIALVVSITDSQNKIKFKFLMMKVCDGVWKNLYDKNFALLIFVLMICVTEKVTL